MRVVMGVNGSYQKLTGFQPVKLSDVCSAAVLPLYYCPLTPRAIGSLTPAVEDCKLPLTTVKNKLLN